jgi:hypothetical protein
MSCCSIVLTPLTPFFNVNSNARKHSWMGQVSKPRQAERVNREGRDICLGKDRQQTEKEGDECLNL